MRKGDSPQSHNVLSFLHLTGREMYSVHEDRYRAKNYTEMSTDFYITFVQGAHADGGILIFPLCD